MTTTVLLLSIVLQHQAVDKPTVQYYQGSFAIRSRGVESNVPLSAPVPAQPKFVAFRKNDVFAVWDERGLTVRRGEMSTSTRFPEIATSPRAFSRPEILKTIERIRKGEATKEATGLSGSKRLGKNAYFLLRWDDKSGKPWAEALVQVDLTASKPRPQLLGRFEGLSMGAKAIDDKLQVVKGKLAIVEHAADSWGLATYDPTTRIFQTQPIGGALTSYQALNLTQGLFVETSAYGTTIAGRVDLVKGTRKILYEGRDQVRFLDTATPEIVVASSGAKAKLVNCVTGAVRLIPYSIDARRVDKNVLIWTPPTDPKAVWLMSPDTWDTLAIWRSQ